MLPLAWLAIKGFFSGALKSLVALAAQVPLKVWVAVGIAVVAWTWHGSAMRTARAEAATAAVAKMKPQLDATKAELLDAWTAAADAEGRDIVHAAGLSACVGTRMEMTRITTATVAHREQKRAEASKAVETAKRDLSNAYLQSPDRCAAEPIPADVLRVLDAASSANPN